VNGHANSNATTRRPGRAAARIAGTAAALLLSVTAAAVPAQAATTTTPAPAATTTATAGVTWAALMHRKFDADAELIRLTALLPGLRATATTRTAALATAQRTRTAAAAALTTATTADQAARAAFATAKTTAATAATAVTTAQNHKPLHVSQVTLAKRALVTANAAVQARTATVAHTTATLTTARTAATTAVTQLTAATTASAAATRALTVTQVQAAALPKTGASLIAQANTLKPQVVTQARTSTTTTRVYGITVNTVIAYPFQRMIDDAARAGIPLSGGGFRTEAQQIALRKSNGCPDVWTAPSSSCRVPTAIPGRSLHEVGLAIDLTTGGRTITDRRSAAYKWLAANAARYGFVNLPSEAWHWSLTGS
jgi:D-alanyl-D-alanine carboxypeptidase